MNLSNTRSLKLVNLNIEGDNHLSQVISFLEKERADIACLQEVLDKDVEKIKVELGMTGKYVPLVNFSMPNTARVTPNSKWGILMLTGFENVKIDCDYYTGSEDSLPEYVNGNPNIVNRVILTAHITQANTIFTIKTTHFTWSEDGKTTSLQLDSLKHLLTLLNKDDEFVLCGDFNAPRGKEIWSILAEKFTDNIPSSITTTLDKTLHKNPQIPDYVVDGLFSTKEYEVSDIKVILGVSDHAGLVANVRKAK